MMKSSHPYQVTLLGGFQIMKDGESIRLPTRKTCSLFAFLILHPEPHSREKLAALLWGDSPDEKARGSLRKALNFLRVHLEPEIILADREVIQLNPEVPLWVDAIAFEHGAQLYLSNPSSVLDGFNLDWYQGDLLVDFYDDWVSIPRENLRRTYLDVLHRYTEQLRSQSEYQAAIDTASRILQMDPSNETAHQHLMFCRAVTGDRNGALQQYQDCKADLWSDLTIEPSRQTQALYNWIRGPAGEVNTLAARLTNLPIPISSFVGREIILSEIKALLKDARLLTLTGIGGCGKTRLAIQTSLHRLDRFEDGVWWVDLTPLEEGSLVPAAVAKALGVPGRSTQSLDATLIHYLHAKQLLLVLDNCEHLLQAAAKISEKVLGACPGLKILATSREPLGIPGEQLWQVSPMSLPKTEGSLLVNALLNFEGIRLFVNRTMEINPDFQLTEDNASQVVRICQHLDGIPLAIELAAARTLQFGVEEIAERLKERFDLLKVAGRRVHPRHQTLRAAMDWSYTLLSQDEASLFENLSVFADGWTLEAAEYVCSGAGLHPGKIAELLEQLLRKSLIHINEDRVRYGMLATIRQYAWEKLTQSGIQYEVSQRYFAYTLAFMERADQMIRGPEQIAWLGRIDQEHENILHALTMAINTPGNYELGVRLINRLHHYWILRGKGVLADYWMAKVYGRIGELERNTVKGEFLFHYGGYSVLGKRWLEPVKAHALTLESLEIWEELGPDYQVEVAKCLVALGFSKIKFVHEADGWETMYRGIQIFEDAGETWWQAWSCIALGNVMDPEDKAFSDLLEKMERLWAETGDPWHYAYPFDFQGGLALYTGDYEKARDNFQHGLEIFRKYGSVGMVHQLVSFLGHATYGLGELDKAEEHYLESNTLAFEYGSFPYLAVNYYCLGNIELRRGNYHQAAELFQKALLDGVKYKVQQVAVISMAGLAAAALNQGETQKSAHLFGAFQRQREQYLAMVGRTKLPFPLVFREEINQNLARCKEKLDPVDFETCWQEGYQMTMEAILDQVK